MYSKKWFDTLPEEIQTALTEVDPELVAWGRNQVRIMVPVLLKNLARYGYEVYEPTAEELAPFKAAQKNTPEKIAKELGKPGMALFQAIRKTM